MTLKDITNRTIWLNEDGWSVDIIDQTKLPHIYEIAKLKTVDDAAHAIKAMLVRGAPLIGATAAYGMCLALHKDASDENLANAYDLLMSTRPTAVNLQWALNFIRNEILPLAERERRNTVYALAANICDEDADICSKIGDHGLSLIEQTWEVKGKSGTINILTHCNAGSLATVEWGTATAPIYKAHQAGIPVHVWVDETRPRNQGASLTAWELQQNGVPCTLIVDNAGGHLMQHGFVDLCMVGTDRTTASGDVCNKIGTYLKALAAWDNDVPFYVCLPSPTIDWTIDDGLKDIPIEEREGTEVSRIVGKTEDGQIKDVLITSEGINTRNDAFDVTPAEYITGLITEHGIFKADKEHLSELRSQLGL